MEKKGELTTQQIVVLVILITSFAVILILFWRLNLGEVSESEVCHNSVVMVGKSKLGGALDCNTQYLCISGGNDCSDFVETEKIEVDLSNPASAAIEINRIIADKMADCWWMFGESEVEYIKGLQTFTGFHCGVCSVIKFDDSIQSLIGTKLDYGVLYNSLESWKFTESQTYLEYLYGVYDLNGFSKKITKSGFTKDVQFSPPIIDLTKKYVIITGMNQNWPSKDAFISPLFVSNDEISTQTNCDVFDVTKA